MIEVNESNFDQEVISSDIPVLVDFWAPWCGPCRMLIPVLEQLSTQYSDTVKFVKINVDESPDLSLKYDIQGVPAVIIFNNGEIQGEPMVGVKPTEEYQAILEQLSSGDNSLPVDIDELSLAEVTGKDQFSKALSDTDKLVLVDFWAPWCGPCRMLGPVLEAVALEMKDNVQIIKINVDQPENQELAMDNQVSSIPQVNLYKNGEKIDQFVGALPLDGVKSFIQKNI